MIVDLFILDIQYLSDMDKMDLNMICGKQMDGDD